MIKQLQWSYRSILLSGIAVLTAAVLINLAYPISPKIFTDFSFSVTTDFPVDGEQIGLKDTYTFTSANSSLTHPARITFFYRCRPTCPHLEVSISGTDNKATSILIDHPVFDRYPMPHISNGTLSFYQAHPDFTTINEFLSHPPRSQVLTELYLAQKTLPPFLNTRYFSYYDATSSPPDYIFTSYLKPRTFGDWYEFTRLLDPSLLQHQPLTATISARLNDEDEKVTLLQPQFHQAN